MEAADLRNGCHAPHRRPLHRSLLQSAPIHSCTTKETEHHLLPLDKQKRLDVIIESSGGFPGDAYKIANLLRSRGEQLVLYVPRWAKSAATLICLVADEIRIRETAELGPLDTQIPSPRDSTDTMSALNGFKGLEAMSQVTHKFVDETVMLLMERTGMKVKEAYAMAIDLVTPIVGGVYEQIDSLELGQFKQSLEIAREYGIRLLARAGSGPSAAACLNALVYDYPSHDFVIDYQEAIDIGLPVSLVNNAEDKLLRQMFELMNHRPYIGLPSRDSQLTGKADAKTRKPRKKRRKAPASKETTFPAPVSREQQG